MDAAADAIAEVGVKVVMAKRESTALDATLRVFSPAPPGWFGWRILVKRGVVDVRRAVNRVALSLRFLQK